MNFSFESPRTHTCYARARTSRKCFQMRQDSVNVFTWGNEKQIRRSLRSGYTCTLCPPVCFALFLSRDLTGSLKFKTSDSVNKLSGGCHEKAMKRSRKRQLRRAFHPFSTTSRTRRRQMFKYATNMLRGWHKYGIKVFIKNRTPQKEGRCRRIENKNSHSLCCKYIYLQAVFLFFFRLVLTIFFFSIFDLHAVGRSCLRVCLCIAHLRIRECARVLWAFMCVCVCACVCAPKLYWCSI